MHDNQEKYRIIIQLAEYLGKKTDPDQIEHFVKQLRYIPQSFLLEFCNNLIATTAFQTPSKFPSPQDIKNAHRASTGSDDMRRSQVDRMPCNDCDGEGLLWYKHFEPSVGYMVEYTARCGSCKNHRRHGNLSHYPVKTRLQLMSEHREIFPYEPKTKVDY